MALGSFVVIVIYFFCLCFNKKQTKPFTKKAIIGLKQLHGKDIRNLISDTDYKINPISFVFK